MSCILLPRINTTVRLLPGTLKTYWDIKDEGLYEPPMVRERSQNLLDENHAGNDALIELTSCLSGYSLAEPAFGTFSKVFWSSP